MKTIAALSVVVMLSACSLPVFFRVPVVQGNIVTAKQVQKLQIGMNKRQVKYILGTPLVNPAFETNRWDYVFYYRDPRAHVRHSALKLYFAHDKLASIGGDQRYRSRPGGPNENGPLGNQPLPSSVTPGPNYPTVPRRVPRGPTNRPTPSDAIPKTGPRAPGGPGI